MVRSKVCSCGHSNGCIFHKMETNVFKAYYHYCLRELHLLKNKLSSVFVCNMEQVLEWKTDFWCWQRTPAVGLFLLIWKGLDLTSLHKYFWNYKMVMNQKFNNYYRSPSKGLSSEFLLYNSLCSGFGLSWVWIQELLDFRGANSYWQKWHDRGIFIIKTICSLSNEMCYLCSCRNTAKINYNNLSWVRFF